MIEKRREKIPNRCDSPHPTEEWVRIEGDEYVFYAHTCSERAGHSGHHSFHHPSGGARITWSRDPDMSWSPDTEAVLQPDYIPHA